MNDNSIPDVDIFRGGSPTSCSFGSAASSSSSSFVGGRLGAIAAVVEIAISRWARQWTRGTASDSSSSSSSRSSVTTLSRPQWLRIRRRRSAATVQSEQSERDIAARISLLKAREESRQVPRNFTLYLPPSLSSSKDAAPCIIPTTSLPVLLQQLDMAVKKATKAHRSYDRQHLPSSKSHAKRPMRHQDYMLPSPAVPSLISQSTKPKVWYLDVASPTWEDMRNLGKILHLHPLTLEDILQRDPREKLELFPKLGYYFISFRAIDSVSRNRTEMKDRIEILDGTAPDVGIIGEANVYLVVFKEGICSFHFTNISEHTDRIRNRIMLLQEVINMTSDWIAHGILDSIVDSFFPLLEEIEREVAAIEDLVLTAGGGTSSIIPQQYDTQHVATSYQLDEKGPRLSPDEEKYSTASLEVRFSSRRPTISPVFRRIRRAISIHWRRLWVNTASHLSPTQITLRRMARTRRLITSLTRLLATKSEVVAQIRKRLLTVDQSKGEDSLNVAMYMGDIQGKNFGD
ncbi:hypothetical protein C0993_012575 [Termitomyces sp. T159_Od127]|nr:hypothetical protein C0993_012575 [Termitomyces sp. T159_Od127]